MHRRVLYLLVLLGNSWVCFRILKEYGYEGAWMPLQSIMNFSFPPPVGHRVLFVLLADGIQAVFPSLGYLKCFLLSQLLAILLAFEAIRRWGGSVRPRRVVHRRPVTSDRYSDSHPALL